MIWSQPKIWKSYIGYVGGVLNRFFYYFYPIYHQQYTRSKLNRIFVNPDISGMGTKATFRPILTILGQKMHCF